MNFDRIMNKVKDEYPYCNEKKQTECTERLMNINPRLYLNIEEWLEDKPFSDIWIRNKYCIRAVLQLRKDNDFIDAILALDEYSQNASYEYRLWRQRR